MAKTPRVRIERDSPVPIYRQIVDSLRILLVEGELSPGDALPSVRRLALELSITFNTVAQAYRSLAEEGWLDLHHGKRATVIRRNKPQPATNEKVAYLRRRTRELIAQIQADGLSPAQIASELRLAATRLES